MSGGLKGISCQKSGALPQQTPKMLEDNVESLGKSLGMDKECVRSSSLLAKQSAQSGSMKVGPFGLGGKAKWAKSNSSVDKKFNERGCGNLILDSKKILNAASRMNCTLNSTASESSIATNASSTVEITVSEAASDKQAERLEKLMARTQDRITMVHISDASEKSKKAAVGALQSSLADLKDSYDQIGVLNIRGSTIRAKAGVKIKSITKATASQTKKIEESYNTITAAAAENAVKQHLGESASQASTKKLITQQIENRSEDVRNDISTTLTESKVSVNASGKIKLTAPKAINLVDTTVDASVAIDIAVSAMAGNAMQLGRTIGSDIASEIMSKNRTDQKADGVDTVQDSMNDAIKVGVEAGTKNDFMEAMTGMVAMLVFAVVGLVVVFLGARAVASRRSSGGGSDEYEEDDEN
jgi:hypothetical protein